MSLKTLHIAYWVIFALSVVVLFSQAGLVLVALAPFILAVLIMQVSNGIGLRYVEDRKALVLFSAFNLLAFALIRPDGVHTLNENGLSKVLDIFDVHINYSASYENYFVIGSLTLLVSQIIVDVWLWRSIRRSRS